MNFKLNILLFLLGFLFITSCNKENIDDPQNGNPTIDPTLVLCDLVVNISNDANTLSAIINGGTPPYTMEWSTGETSDRILATADGDYFVAVTDADECIVITTIPVRLIQVACVATITLKRETTGTILTANMTGGDAPYTYEWASGETTQIIDITAASIYAVTITGSGGCTASKSFDTNDTRCIDFGGRILLDASFNMSVQMIY